MKKLIALALILMSTGCSHIIVNTIGKVYDNNDGCQLKNNGGNVPSYCGAANGSTAYVRDFRTGNYVYTIRTK